MGEKTKRQPVIVTTGENGRAVVYGYVEQDPVVGEPITVHGARMVLRWASECGGLFGLAAAGPKGATSITHAVERTGCVVTQWLTVSSAAAELIDGWPAA